MSILTLDPRRLALPGLMTLAMMTVACGTDRGISAAKQAEDEDGNDAVVYSAAAQAVLRQDRCAKAAAEATVSELIGMLMDWGVDLPDQVVVETIVVKAANSAFRVVLSDQFAADVGTAPSGCRVRAAIPLKSLDFAGDFDSQALRRLVPVADEVLGEEFFGSDNIGGAFAMQLTGPGRDLDAASAVGAWYREWRDLDATAAIQTDRSEAAVREALASMNVKAVEGSDGTGAKADEILGLIMQALAERKTLVLVTGSWFDTGIGDPAAAFVAIFDRLNGEGLVLEQGYAD